MGKKIKRIEVEAFRGYENKAIFNFTNENNLVSDLIVLHAPNGFGKTSFFESVEWCLSAKLMRIEKNKILQDSEDKDRGFTLKNKNSEKEFGEVKITTDDSKIIYRQTGKSRNGKLGFKDYGYENLITNEVTKPSFDITSHLLTQDGMDSFLRFTNSKEKFDALTNFWKKGEETSEKYRKLEKLFSKVQKKIVSLHNNITKIKQEIESVEITQDEVDNVNSKLKNINNKLSEDKKIKFSLEKNTNTKKIIQFSDELKKLTVDVEQEVKKLEDKQSKLEDIKINFLQFKEAPKSIENLKTTIDNNAKLINSFKVLVSLEKEFEGVNNEIIINEIKKEKVLKLSNLYPKFEDIKKEINNLNNKINNFIKITKTELIKNRQDVEKKSLIEKKNLETIIKNKELLNKKIESIKLYSKELLTNYLKKNKYEKNFISLEKEYKDNDVALQLIIDEKKEIENDKSFHMMYKNSNFVISEKFKFHFEKLKELYLKKEELNTNYNALVEKKAKSLALKSDITKLTSLGIDLIKDSQTNICPLCKHPHSTYNELLERVLIISEDILDINKIAEEVENEKLNFEKSKNDFIKKEIELKNLIHTYLSSLEKTFYTINEVNKNKKIELDKVSAYIVSIDNEQEMVLKNLQSVESIEVINHSIETIRQKYSEFVESLSNNIETLNKKEKSSIEQIEIFSKEINKLNEKTQEVDNDIENTNIKRNTLETNPDLVEYNKLFLEFSLSEENEKKQIEDKLKEFAELISKYKKKSLEMNNRINVLKKELGKKEFNQITLEIQNSELKTKEKELHEFLEKIKKLLINFNLPIDLNEEKLLSSITECIMSIELKDIFIKEIKVFDNIIQEFITDLNIDEKEKEIESLNKQIQEENTLLGNVKVVKSEYKNFIEQTISRYFNTKTINEIYNRIDPHPIQKEVKFIPELDEGTKLRVKTSGSDGQEDDPTLYNSSGQISILSLSIFLAKALQTKDELDTIFMDDPIQYLDSINVLSFIDLLRTIITKEKRQIVISTHDKNFYQLLQKKLDSKYYNSKFIELESYGKIKSEDY